VHRFFKVSFILAGLYNFAFALWTALWPQSFFTLFGLAPTNHPAIWQCLGMVIGVYGAGYLWAASRPDRAGPIIALGLAGKILGPVGWGAVVASGDWPLRTGWLIVFNDLIWWIPFSLFLLRKKT
jgi:small multidrug resistance pump